MRKFTAILFTAALLSVSAKELVIYGVFKLNQAYITSSWCVNRDQPEMKCNGKCQLKKAVKSSQQSESNLPILEKDNSEVIYLPVFSQMQFPEFKPGSDKLPDYCRYLNSDPKLLPVFQPPEIPV